MNTTQYITAASLCALLLVTGLVVYKYAPQAQSATGANQADIPIGFIAPLTGSFAGWGESIQHGMELAVQDTRHKFSVDYQDDGCSSQNGASIGQEMLTIKQIHLIIGPGCSNVLEALAPTANANKALMFSTGLLSDDAFINPSVINLATQISTEGEFMAAYLKSQGVQKIAFVHGDNDFGVEFGKRFPVSAAKRGMTLTTNESTSVVAADFRTTALKVIQSHPDAIFIHQGENQIGLFVKQLRESGSSIPVYAYYGAESPSTIAAGGSAVEGLQYTYPVDSADDTSAVTAFNQRYAAAYGASTTPTATSYFVYDGMMLLDKALAACSATDTACIKNYFISIGTYHGLSGDMTFKSDGSIVRPFGIKEIKNGRFVWITKQISL